MALDRKIRRRLLAALSQYGGLRGNDGRRPHYVSSGRATRRVDASASAARSGPAACAQPVRPPRASRERRSHPAARIGRVCRADGCGKSTLAAALGLCGCHVLTDDCLVVDHRETSKKKTRSMAVLGYPGLRLWRDSARGLGLERDAVANVVHYTVKRRLLTDAMKFRASPSWICVISCSDGGVSRPDRRVCGPSNRATVPCRSRRMPM